MARYRKIPVVIEAKQWYPGIQIDGVCGCLKAPGAKMHLPHVHTLEGPLNVSHGDWIITGVEGEKYPCKDSVFKKTYEEVK